MTRRLELTVPELDCADEARQIETALGRVDGVLAVQTAIGARRVIVSFDPVAMRPQAVEDTIRGLGMTVSDTPRPAGRQRSLADTLGWTFVSIIALLTLAGLVAERLGFADAVVELIPAWLAVAAVLSGGYPIFGNVIRALRRRAVTSHALMTLGIVGALAIGQYGAAAVIVFFMRLADFIEGYTTEHSRQAIKELLTLAPETARVERNGQEVEVPAEQVRPGEVVLIKSGERIPVDGVVLEGRAAVNESSITGESIPAEKAPGAEVFAATICDRGALRVRVERVGKDTTFGQILRLVEQADANKAPVQRFADRFTAYYIPVVIAIALATYAISGNTTAAVATVLVACSCAIAMATPTTVLAAVGWAARRGIVVKGGRYLEALAKVDVLVMDKTGTVTVGRPEVTDVLSVGGATEESLLGAAASIEQRSEHPLADGIVRAVEKAGLNLESPTKFEVHPGEGVTGHLGGDGVICGTERLLARLGVEVPEAIRQRVAALAGEGKSVVLVARSGRLIGLVALADTLRSEVAAAIEQIRALGIRRVILLTGDREPAAAAVAARLGIEFEAELLPVEKIGTVERLQREGHVVAMVGDGINDAPALAQADVGIAMGVAGTDAAIEAAHVALMRDDWRMVPEAIALGRRAFGVIKQNLWFTAGYNAVGILLAATGWLPPVGAAAAQSLPDVVVMLNSTRLLRSRSLVGRAQI
jgi:Cd2+/Zn2+-exporting ATPase/Cu+-exporting ATPase